MCTFRFSLFLRNSLSSTALLDCLSCMCPNPKRSPGARRAASPYCTRTGTVAAFERFAFGRDETRLLKDALISEYPMYGPV